MLDVLEQEPIEQDGKRAAALPDESKPSDPLDDRPPECRFSEVTCTGLLLLLAAGLIGTFAGVAAAAACVGLALVINVTHNLLPVYVFVLPMCVVLLLALAPAVYGYAVGKATGGAAVFFKHKHPESAGLIAACCAAAGIGAAFYAAEFSVPAERSFFGDVLLPFVYLMLGGCLNFQWLAEPQPFEIAPWIVYTALGISAVLGLLIGFGAAVEAVEEAFVPAKSPDSTDSEEKLAQSLGLE